MILNKILSYLCIGLVIANVCLLCATSILWTVSKNKDRATEQLQHQILDLENTLMVIDTRQTLLEDTYTQYYLRATAKRKVITDAQQQIDSATDTWINDLVPTAIRRVCEDTLQNLTMSSAPGNQ